MLDDIQGVHPKLIDDPPGHHRPDPLDQSRAQVPGDALGSGREHGPVVVHRELVTILAMPRPHPLQLERLAGIDVGQAADDGHQVQFPLDRQADHTVSVFLVCVRHPFDDAAQLFGQAIPFLAVNYIPTRTRRKCRQCSPHGPTNARNPCPGPLVTKLATYTLRTTSTTLGTLAGSRSQRLRADKSGHLAIPGRV